MSNRDRIVITQGGPWRLYTHPLAGCATQRPPVASCPPGAANKVRYDSRADVIRIGRSSATVGEVTAALSEVARQREPERVTAIIGAGEDLEQVIVRVSKTERAQLKIRAAEADMTQQDYMRAMLLWTALL